MAEIKESDEILSDFGSIKRLNSFLVYRVAVRRSQSQGLSIIEYKPQDEKAISEFNKLYKEVFDE